MHEHVECDLGVLVALLDQAEDLTEVVVPAQALETRLLVEHGVDLVDRVAALAVQVEDHSRINVTGTGTHDKALEWG